ncbi:MAG: urease accessory protein UreD [Actinomycetota bacterium]
MSSALRARAAVGARLIDGATRLTTLRSDPPLTLRDAAGAVYLAASAAGPVGGDEVELDVHVGPGAVLEVRTVAATLALPGPVPAPSRSDCRVTVGDGAELRWRPEPVVAVRGCDHRAVARIDLAPTAGLVWREELVLGRHGEPGGSVLQRLEIDRGGVALLRTEHALGPCWPGSNGPAGAGGLRAVGTLVVVGASAAAAASAACGLDPEGAVEGGGRAAWVEPAPGAVVLWAVAPSTRSLRAVLDRVAPS